MLFCLVKREQTKNNDDLPDMEWGIRDGHRNPSAFYLSKRDPKWTDVVTRDFNALTDSDAIVKYVEAYVTSIPPDWKKKRMTLGVPVESPLAEYVLATIHPSAVLRQQDDESRQEEMRGLVRDLRVVAGLLA